MKTRYLSLTALVLSTALSGCGSMLAAVESGPIEQDPGERSIARQVLDESIETKAVVNIRAANDNFDSASLLVVSYNGYVLICGEVASEQLKQQASDVVREIEGVRRIYNELEIGQRSATSEDAKDVWITTNVKTALLTASDTPGMRIKVVTENRVVYLMGLLTEEEADRSARVAAGIDGVTRVVKLFELI